MKLATLCYLYRDGQTLMLRRNKKQADIHFGKWNGLGGKLEQGETPEQCVIREVLEESGLAIVSPQLKGVLTFPKFKDDEDWYVFVYTVSEFSGTLIDSPEGELEWIDNNKLEQLNLWQGDRIFLPWLSQPAFFSGKFVYIKQQLVEHNVVFY